MLIRLGDKLLKKNLAQEIKQSTIFYKTQIRISVHICTVFTALQLSKYHELAELTISFIITILSFLDN